MDAVAVHGLQADGLTYPEVGRTAGALPVGYRHTIERRDLVASADAFDLIATRLLTWQMHDVAGFDVRTSHSEAVPGAVVTLRRRFGPIMVTASCRVVYVVDEPTRRGFAYGTLPGHPECGEEAFVIERHADDRLSASVVAFSRPSSFLARAAGPIGRRAQERATARYLFALEA